MLFDLAKVKQLKAKQTQFFNRTLPSKAAHLPSKVAQQFSLPVLKTEVLAGITVALALIPESIGIIVFKVSQPRTRSIKIFGVGRCKAINKESSHSGGKVA